MKITPRLRDRRVPAGAFYSNPGTGTKPSARGGHERKVQRRAEETHGSLSGIADTLLQDRRMDLMLRIWLGLVIGLGMIAPASASSGDAWQAMRGKLRTGCASKATAIGLGRIEINVDPFGSQSYGIAIVTKCGAGRKQNVSYVCIMDKKTGAVEMGGEIPLQ
ncbi:hypothetical protein AAII07_36715 [Microvirga sp. 0TCS3.31]